jgi:hypothetical protein
MGIIAKKLVLTCPFYIGGVMCYAALIVYVEADGMFEQRVRLAAHLADAFNAALIGLSALAISAPLVVDGVLVAETTAADIKEMRAKLADQGNRFRNIAGAIHRDVEWRPVLDLPTETVSA